MTPSVDLSFRAEFPEDEAFLAKLYATTRDIEMALTGWDAARQQAFLRQQFQFQTTHYGAREIRLMDIALMPEFRRSGIGGAILKNLLQEAAQQEKTVTLHVERFNPAPRLYERLGFHVVEDLGINLLMEWPPQAD